MRLLWVALAAFALTHASSAEEADRPYRPLGSHAGGVASVHFSPDGKLVASGGGDKAVRLTDVATGAVRHSLKGPTSFTCVVRFSPDGKTLAAAGYESGDGNAIYRFDVATGKELPKLAGHATGGVRRLLFTPDGKQVVSAGFDGYVRVWDLDTGKEAREIKADAGTVYGLALSPDGRLAATAGRDGLRVWDLATGREQTHGAMASQSCVAVAFSPDGKLIASGDNSTATLWEAATGKEVATLRGFKGEVSALIFAADGRTLFTSSYDKAIRLWEVRTGKLVRTTEAHSGWVWGLSLSPDEKALASCSVDGNLKLWDLAKIGGPVHTALKLTPVDAEARWKDLASGDPGVAYQAVWALAGDPAQSVPLLADRLPSTRGKGPAAADIAKLLADLDSDEWPVREAASRELARHGPHVLTTLKKTLASPPSLEVRKRVERLIAGIDPTALPPEDLVALRGVQALEYIGTPDAKNLLERLSRSKSGTPRLVEEASLAVKRLGRSTPPR